MTDVFRGSMDDPRMPVGEGWTWDAKRENKLEICQEVHTEGLLEYYKWGRDGGSKSTLGEWR